MAEGSDGTDTKSDEVPPGYIDGEEGGRFPAGQVDQPPAEPSAEEAVPDPAPLQRPEPEAVGTKAKRSRRCSCSLPRCPQVSGQNVLQFFQQVPQFYCKTLAKRPWAHLLFWAIVVLVVLPLGWKPIIVDTDVNAYRRADGPASRAQLSYLSSLSFMRAVRNESSLSQRRTLKIEVLYEAKQGSVFGEAVLRDIRAFEQSLKSLAGWTKLCDAAEPALQFQCSPGESFGNYVWPQRLDNFLTTEGFFRLSFDGSALERLPLDAVITYLSEGQAAPHGLRDFLPMAFVQGGDSLLLRSVFGFTAPSLNDTNFTDFFQEFVETELYKVLKEAVQNTRKPADPNSWDRPPAIRIYFRGDALDDYEVMEALYGDMYLAIGPLVLSLIIAWIKMRSAFLAFVGACFLSLTSLVAYVILPVEKVSLASFLGVFLVFGLGFTSFFRIQELWRRSRREAEEHWERLLYLHMAAGREMLPVVCTAACYFLLITSTLVPLREFGIFMGCAMLLAVAFALIFVPVLVMHERSLRPCMRRRLPRKLVLVLEPAELKPNWGLLASKLMLPLSRPRAVVGGTAFVVLICLVSGLAVTASQPYPTLPEVFPPDHHREAGRPLLQTFAPTQPAQEAAPFTIRMCEPGRSLTSCALHWCDLASTANNNLSSWPSSQAAGCSCFQPASGNRRTRCGTVGLALTISGARATAMGQEALVPNATSYLKQLFPTASVQASSLTTRRLQSLVLEDWPSGATHVDPMTELDFTVTFPTGEERMSTSSCQESHICYCSPKICTNPTGYEQLGSELSLPALSDGTAVDSALSQPSSDVVVLFGIEQHGMGLLDKTVAGAFDASFDPASPWSQRAMLRVCDELPASLNVIGSQCWVRDFRAWLISRNQKFPVERFLDFHQTLKEFLVSYPSAASAMWFNEGNNLTATMLMFQVSPADGAEATLAARQEWMSYVDRLNADAASTASGAWATSQAWVDAEALVEALSSAWQVLLSVTGVVMLVGLIYILDIELVLCLLLVAFAVTTAIVFFFFCLCGWSFGPWELTIMTVFLSYAVEPAFHIGHDFINPGLPEGLRAERKPAEPALDAGLASITDGSAAIGAAAPAPPQVQAPRSSGISEVSDVNPKGKDSPEEAIERSIHLVAKNLVSNSLKLMLCGILLAPSHLRIFARLGAISILLPLLCVPAVLLVYPALILASGRTRREPDLLVMGEALLTRASWLWT